MSSPTTRSLELLRELGYTAKVVEHWDPYAKIRQDLFGMDILALKPVEPVLVVQATTGSNHAARARSWTEQALPASGKPRGHSWKSGLGQSKDRRASGRRGR